MGRSFSPLNFQDFHAFPHFLNNLLKTLKIPRESVYDSQCSLNSIPLNLINLQVGIMVSLKETIGAYENR